tara:strand:- start:1429 stop:1740 length:312 start_codon:yes stop_codon:yes gene_type:complete
MRLTKGQLKRIIREEYSHLKRKGLLKENTEAIDGHLVAEVANDAYQEGIRKVGDFIAYFMDGYPEVVAGVPKRIIRAELAAAWKLEKAANRPYNKYDNWSAWD